MSQLGGSGSCIRNTMQMGWSNIRRDHALTMRWLLETQSIFAQRKQEPRARPRASCKRNSPMAWSMDIARTCIFVSEAALPIVLRNMNDFCMRSSAAAGAMRAPVRQLQRNYDADGMQQEYCARPRARMSEATLLSVRRES